MAAGVADIENGDVTAPDRSTSFSQLDEREQKRRVAAALEDLVNRGLVRRTDDANEAGDPLPGSPLDLVRAATAAFFFFGTWASARVDSGSPYASGCVYGLRIPPSGRAAALDERIDHASSTYDYTLRTPEDYVALMSREVFTDGPPLFPADEGSHASGTNWGLSVTWANGQVQRNVQWMTVRLPSDRSAVLAKVRSYGLRRRDTGKATEEGLRQGLAEMFAEIGATEPAPPRG